MPQITGAGIVLPKLTENDQLYTQNRGNRLKQSLDKTKKEPS